MRSVSSGLVLNCNRKAKNPNDRVGSVFHGHHAPIYGLRRNPFFPKYFLSMGDWSARLWNEDLKTPLIHTAYTQTDIRGGAWSPTRPAVFYLIRADGSLDIWDLCYKSTAPTLSVRRLGRASSRGRFCHAGSRQEYWSVIFCDAREWSTLRRGISRRRCDDSGTQFELCRSLFDRKAGRRSSDVFLR